MGFSITGAHSECLSDGCQYAKFVRDKDVEIERLRRFLEIAVDAYEDEHGQPSRDSHWAARARAALSSQQLTQPEK